MNKHYHCWWCGHVIEMDCGYSVVAASNEPARHLCHGANHDCAAAAYEAREASRRAENTRHALGV